MTDNGPVRPRRAFAPLPDDDSAAPAGVGRRSLRPGSEGPARRSADAETQLLRRVIPPDSSRSPASPASAPSARVWTPSPVPPPRPVLPEPSTLPASAGRRFSAGGSPQEVSYAPRRSATSVASPPEHFSPAAPFARAGRPAPASSAASAPGGRHAQHPALPGEPRPRTTGAARALDPKPPTRRSGRRALIVLGGVAVIVGLVIGGVTWLAPKSPSALTSPTTTSSPSPLLDPLLGPTDLGRLGTTSWDTIAAAPGGGDGNPVCLPVTSETMPTADRTGRRVLTSPEAHVGYVSHVVDTYPDRSSAASAYQQRLLQAGACADTSALIVDTYDVTGLTDDAFVTRIQVQGTTVENHTVLVSQTGRNLSMIDISAPDPVTPEDAVVVATQPLARLCSAGQGACPTTPELVASLPAAAQYPGWLIEADLPRITPGAGRWAASRPDPKLSIVGSKCEAVPLKKVDGVTASAQRTLLLADDPAAPTSLVFGVDQVVYTFPNAKESKAFADKVTDNIADCAKTVPTATVAKGPAAKGNGAEATEFSGRSFLVTQQTGSSNAATYRVGVVRVAERVGYLLANPSADFDFTDAQWGEILQRAGQRISQMP